MTKYAENVENAVLYCVRVKTTSTQIGVKMSYIDEKMIKAMNAHKEGVQGSIEEGIFIKEELYTFKEIDLFDNKMQIMLPESFTDMPIEQAKLKYPMEQRPQVIKTNKRTDINYTFSLLEQPIENRQMKMMRDSLRRALRRARPDMKFMEDGLEEVEGHTIGWFEFISNGLDGKLYNMMYFTPIDNKLMQGIFNCPIKEAQNWKSVVLQVMHTIKEGK